jgi:hypothetical protein
MPHNANVKMVIIGTKRKLSVLEIAYKTQILYLYFLKIIYHNANAKFITIGTKTM